MTAPRTHTITIIPAWKADARELWWRAVCSCGAYRSVLFGYRGHAEIAGRAHAKAKNEKPTV